MTQAFLYKWVNTETGTWYVGSRTASGCHLLDGYICSSRFVKEMIKNNPSEWRREILAIGESLYIAELEGKYLTEVDAKQDPTSYNRSNSGRPAAHNMVRMYKEDQNAFVPRVKVGLYEANGWSCGFSPASKQKMSSNHADVSGSKNPMYGSSRYGEQNPFYGKKHTEETLSKLRRPKRDDEKRKMSIAKRGNLNSMFGKKQKRICCETCGKEVPVNAYARFHGSRCKQGNGVIKDLKLK